MRPNPELLSSWESWKSCGNVFKFDFDDTLETFEFFVDFLGEFVEHPTGDIVGRQRLTARFENTIVRAAKPLNEESVQLFEVAGFGDSFDQCLLVHG